MKRSKDKSYFGSKSCRRLTVRMHIIGNKCSNVRSISLYKFHSKNKSQISEDNSEWLKYYCTLSEAIVTKPKKC